MNTYLLTETERRVIRRILEEGTLKLTPQERTIMHSLRYRLTKWLPSIKAQIEEAEAFLEFLEYKNLFKVIVDNWRHFKRPENFESLLLSWFQLRETFRELPQSERRRLLKQLMTRKNSSLSIEPSKGSDSSGVRRTA